MKRTQMIGLLLVVLALGAGLSAYVCKGHNENECCKKAHECNPCEWMKDVKVEVTNIESGVLVKMTSGKPEVVKKIQECASNCKGCHDSGEHSHREGTTEHK